MKSKTLILSSIAKEHDGRGILTLYQEDDLLKCKLRLYNTAELTAYCKLGIYHKKEVFTANLLNKSGQYESSFVGDFDIDADFYCAIIDTKNNNNVILAGGTYAGYYFNDTAVFDTKSATDDEAEQQETIQPETTCEDCDKCKNCKYKEYFYSEQNLHLQKTTEKETETKKDCDILTNTTKDLKQDETQNQAEKLASILDSIIPQFKYVFEIIQQTKI
ncbi:MAG: hypothetical protein IKM43_02105 [Clostridia bacterium]|nr:hypothetical protein [Clostridia bacterium]